MTWPLVTQLGSAIPGDGFDGWQNVWNLWWMRSAWLERHTSAFFTNMLHYPIGADLRFQTMAPFNGLMFLNVQLALGLLPAYNAAVLFSFVVGGYGAYLLALYALSGPVGTGLRLVATEHDPSTRPKRPALLYGAAFVAGVVYAFSPYHFAHLLGHLQLIALQWIPFYVLYLVRGLERAEATSSTMENPSYPAPAKSGGRTGIAPNWAVDAFKVGLFLILVALCDWYYVMYCLLFTGLLLAVRLLQRQLSWRGLRLIAGSGILFGLAVAPLLVPMIQGARSWTGQSLLRSYEETLTLSADLLAFFTPQVFHPLWGTWAAMRSASFTATRSEFTVFVGYTVLVLVGIALMTIRNSKRSKEWASALLTPQGAGFWCLAAVFFALLSLGPVLKINGQTELLPGGGQVPLPYALLYEIVPFIKLSRSVSRMSVMVMLCLGVAASFGVFALSNWWARRANRHKSLARLVPVAASLLIAFEFLPAPYPISPPDTPSWYQTLGKWPGLHAVLNVPANWERPGYLLYQTVHAKPMATGYVTRDDPQSLVERAPVLTHFRWLGPDVHTQDFDLTQQGVQVLHDLLDVRWVVLDRYKMPGDREREITEAYAAAIFDQAGVAPIFQDDRITVYEVPAPRTRAAYLILAPGWPSRQLADDGSPQRLLPQGTAVGVEVVTPEGAPFALEVEVTAPPGGSITLQNGEGKALTSWVTSGDRTTFRTDQLHGAPIGYQLELRYSGPPGTQAVIHSLRVIEDTEP